MPDRLHVLYVGQTGPQLPADLEAIRGGTGQFRVSIADDREWPTASSLDCLLVDLRGHDSDRIAAIRQRYPEIPLLAIDRVDRANALLEGGATDVIQSTPDGIPSRLLCRRLEQVCNVTPGSAVRERYETILDTAADAIFQLDADGRIVAVNETAVSLSGYDRWELVGSFATQFSDDISARRGRAILSRAMASDDSVQTFEMTVETKDGRSIPCETRLAVRTREDQLVWAVAIARDITDQKRRKRELEQQNDLFTKAQDIADVGAWEYDRAGDHVWTEKVFDILGRETETVPSLEEVSQYFTESDWPQILAAVERALSAGESFSLEAKTSHDNPRWVRIRGDPQTEDGSVVRIRGTIQDITRDKNHERRLERNRNFLRQTQQVGNVGGWEYDVRTEELRWTDEVYHIHGLPPTFEPTIEAAVACYHPADRERLEDAIETLVSTGEAYDLELRLEPDDGDQRWIQTHGESVQEDGEVVKIQGVIRDIHERKQREQQLQAERDLTERILETSLVGITVHDADGTVRSANETALEILDVSSEDITGDGPNPTGVTIVGGEDGPTQLPVEQVLETGEAVRDVEVTIETHTGERVILRVNAVPMFEDEAMQRVVVTFDDVTERVTREQRLEGQRDELARLDRINRIIREIDTALVGASTRREVEQAVCDQLSNPERYRGTVVFRPGTEGPELVAHATGRAESPEHRQYAEMPAQSPVMRALTTGETQFVEGVVVDDRCPTAGAFESEENVSMVAVPLSYGQERYGVLVVGTATDDSFSERELDVFGELGETVGYAISAVESREREATVTSLYETTQDLLGAESADDVCEVVVETASSVLDPPGIGLFLFDDDENVLRPVAATDRLREFYGDSMVFGPSSNSVTWETYVSGEQRLFADVSRSEQFVNPETDARTMLQLPLGNHGVFVVATDRRVSFSRQKRRLVGLLGTTTEAALDRVAGHQGIAERDRRLAERAARLERFEQLFSLFGAVDTVLHRAGTRQEIERGVTERTVETGPCSFAWIGTVPPDGSVVEPREWATAKGASEEYLDAVSLAIDSEEPAARAAATGETVCLSNVTDHLRETDWARVALSHRYQSVLAVPLVYGETTYGVLTVYAERPGAFDSVAGRALEALGETVARGINAVETERAVLAERAVELELHLPETETFLNAVAEATGEPIVYQEVTPTSDGRAHVLFSLSETSVEDLRSLATEFVAVESLEGVERGDETLFRATIAGPTIDTTLLACGAIPRDVSASADGTTATVRLPRDRDVRVLLERVRERYPQTELRSRRNVERGEPASVSHALQTDLTERQHEVLRTAYESGFFESPRETTGVELGDLLGISQPTVTHHLREAQRRLFEAMFDQQHLDI